MSTTNGSSQGLNEVARFRAASNSGRHHSESRVKSSWNGLLNFVLGQDRKRQLGDEEIGILLQRDPYKGKARDELVDALAGTSTTQERKDIEDYVAPQLAFITSQFRLLDDSLLQALGTETCIYTAENGPPFSFICGFLTAVVFMIKSEDAPTLNTVKIYLQDQNLVKSSISDNTAAQLVFAAFGLVTAFFRPSLAPKPNRLQLAEPLSGTVGIRRAGTWQSNGKDIDENILDISLCDLLFRFSQSNEGPIPLPLSPGTKAAPLVSSNLNYYTLSELAGLQIEWIDSICEHLELDTRRKSLKLFRFPSICVTFCAASVDNTTWMEKLFSNAMQPAGSAQEGSEEEKSLRSAQFFREVISSYAILFAQSRHSRSKFQSHQRSGRSRLPDHGYDPLLERLYSTEWSTTLIADLGLGDVKLSYKPETDFPFFAHRLERLQDFSLAQIPNSWRLLWKDRRDLNRFYTLWAALVFGILTLSIGLLQVLLTIVQVVASFTNGGGR